MSVKHHMVPGTWDAFNTCEEKFQMTQINLYCMSDVVLLLLSRVLLRVECHLPLLPFTLLLFTNSSSTSIPLKPSAPQLHLCLHLQFLLSPSHCQQRTDTLTAFSCQGPFVALEDKSETHLNRGFPALHATPHLGCSCLHKCLCSYWW